MTVIFHYRAGHEKPMAERYAKLLQRMGHGYYRTDEPEPIHLPAPVVVPVVVPDPVVVDSPYLASDADHPHELPVTYKARRGRKPRFKLHSQPETKTDND